jgi:hypothetical protein
MSKSSIHISNSSASALLHNERVFDVDYAIDDKARNDVYQYHQIQDLVLEAKADYSFHQKNNRSMNKSAKLIKEAIVNLNEHHTIDDVKELCKQIKKEFGYEPMHIAIHRDEGYIDKNTKEKHYNYHAHIMLLNYSFDTHRTIRPTKTTLAKLQDLTASSLKMERGVDKRISKKVRLDTHQYKRAKEEEAQKLNYNFKKYQKDITSLNNLTSMQKRELHQLNSQVKNDTASILELNKKLETLSATNDTLKKENSLYKQNMSDLRAKSMSYVEALNKIYIDANTTDDVVNYVKKLKQIKKQYETTFKKIAPHAKNEEQVLEYVKNLKEPKKEEKKVFYMNLEPEPKQEKNSYHEQMMQNMRKMQESEIDLNDLQKSIDEDKKKSQSLDRGRGGR